VVPEEFYRVDNTPVAAGVFHLVPMAVGRSVPVLRSNGADAHTDPLRDGEHIVLLFDISLLQKRLGSRQVMTIATIYVYISRS
jgi:hypothetical protein